MDLLTTPLHQRLIANAAAHHDAMQRNRGEPDPAPVVKFFNPCGAATWLFSELDADGDTLFGLCDMGFGCPELGSASLAEIASVRVGFGLKIERDLHFTATHPLSVYAEAARHRRHPAIGHHARCFGVAFEAGSTSSRQSESPPVTSKNTGRDRLIFEHGACPFPTHSAAHSTASE